MNAKSLKVNILILALALGGSALHASKYEMTIQAGEGLSLDVAFAATGCAGVCQDVTLACHCYSHVAQTVTYAFPHGTSGQNASVDVVSGKCQGDQFTIRRDSDHDTRCFTCVDGKVKIYDTTCDEVAKQAKKKLVKKGRAKASK